VFVLGRTGCHYISVILWGVGGGEGGGQDALIYHLCWKKGTQTP